MRALLIILVSFIWLPLLAQRECYTVEPSKERIIVNPVNVSPINSNNLFQGNEKSNITSKEEATASAIIRIPVVVHILYNSATQNISDEQVKSQIDALNRDFRKRNSDTINIPARFKSLAADTEIEFELAVVDPKGSATNGIIRKQTTVKEWVMDDKIKFSAKGGDDAWDSKSYLNIWVGNITKTLGYSSGLNGPVEKDGIVISYTVFGTIGISGAFNRGRTLVHETGHWLGLKHIWGDAPCGDDEIDDTPKQAGFTTGCPSGIRSTCGVSGIGDMYMNYMDFTNDDCMYLFTKGQKSKMRANFNENGFRYSILSSKGLDPSSLRKTPEVDIHVPVDNSNGTFGKNPSIKVLLYPNPASRELTCKINDVNWIGNEIKITNLNGVILQRIKITSQTQVVPVGSLQQGIYFAVFQKADERLILKFIKTGFDQK